MADSAVNISRLHRTHQFVGKKIRRIRWQKVTNSTSTANVPENMATASWDETGLNSTNEIAIWHLTPDEIDDNKRRETREIIDDDCFSLTNMPEMDWQFVRSASLDVDADVPELRFIDDDHLLFATAKGDIVIAKWFRSDRSIRQLHTVPRIFGEEPCVGFSLFGNDVVSLSSSGTINVLDIAGVASTLRSNQGINYNSYIGPALCIEHFGVNEVVMGNATGQLQIWDLRKRQPVTGPLNPLSLSASGAVTAVRSHPSQRHLLAAGYQSGCVAFWDLRNTDQSLVSSMSDIHAGPVWELSFHPVASSHLFSAANDGLLLHWNASYVRPIGENFGVSPWSLSGDDLRDQVKRTSLIPGNALPINSLDVVNDSILAAVDDESIWMVKNLPVS